MNARRRQGGFTFVEVLVAIFIMLSATWAAAQGIKGSVRLTRDAMDRTCAIYYAQYWLDYYRHVPWIGNWIPDPEPVGNMATSTRYDSYRNVYYRCQATMLSGQTATTPARIEIRVTPYRPRTAGGTGWVAGRTVTMRTDYYGQARGR